MLTNDEIATLLAALDTYESAPFRDGMLSEILMSCVERKPPDAQATERIRDKIDKQCRDRKEANLTLRVKLISMRQPSADPAIRAQDWPAGARPAG